jgi:hypothetical protein
MTLLLSGTDGLSDVDGSAATPAIRGTDANTGIFFPAADTIAFSEGGAEVARFDSSGNLLLGTTTTGSVGISLPATYNVGWVQGSGASVPNIFRQTSSAATVLANGYRFSATANGFASSFSSSYAKTAISCGTVPGGITFYTDTATTVAAGTDATPSERMRINSSGNVTIGKTDITTSVDGFAVLNSGETRISCSANDVLNLNRNTSNGAIQRFFRSGSLVGQIEGATTGLTYTGINGLTFTATQTASADANTLDDYEEGTWTPVDASGAGLSFSNTSGNCLYTKVGRVVTACFRVSYPTQSNGNFAFIGGLPFTSASTTVACQGVAFAENTYGGDLMGSLQAAETRFILLGVSGGAIVLITNAMLSNKDIRGSITYIASA